MINAAAVLTWPSLRRKWRARTFRESMVDFAAAFDEGIETNPSQSRFTFVRKPSPSLPAIFSDGNPIMTHHEKCRRCKLVCRQGLCAAVDGCAEDCPSVIFRFLADERCVQGTLGP
jgi:hypothetical protein